MQIQLLRCIYTVGFDGCGIVSRIQAIPGHGIDHSLDCDHVVKVSVFAVDILGHDYLGAVATQSSGHACRCDILPAPGGDSGYQGRAGLVRQVADIRVLPDAHGPQAFQQFRCAHAVETAHHVYHHDLQSPFACIGRQQAAEPQDLIVRVCRNQHQVSVPFKGFPALDPIGQFACSEYMNVADPQALALCAADDKGLCGLRKRDPVRGVWLVIFGQQMSFCILKAQDGVAFEQGQHDALRRLPLGALYLYVAAWLTLILPVVLVVVVVHVAQLFTVDTGRELAFGGQVSCLVCCERRTAQQA